MSMSDIEASIEPVAGGASHLSGRHGNDTAARSIDRAAAVYLPCDVLRRS
jgi:hypothetical protein